VENNSTGSEQIDGWKSRGILPQTFYPGSIDNLILLCSGCHSGYDAVVSDWAMLPQDLKFFIDFERADYDARVAAAGQGIRQPRALPSNVSDLSSNSILADVLLFSYGRSMTVCYTSPIYYPPIFYHQSP
jgi:hypothetical protein